MLERGADVRHIQEMLGHAETSTTAIYTRVSIQHLKRVHDATHPTAHVEQRVQEGEGGTGGKRGEESRAQSCFPFSRRSRRGGRGE